MKAEVTDRRDRESSHSHVRLLTAKEALRTELRPIEVPEGAEFLLSPDDPACAAFFARVQIRSHEDLQALGFVPRRLGEEKVRQAMAADDAEAYSLATRMPQPPTQGCACSGSATHTAVPTGNPIRAAYNGIRRRQNLALARVLSDHLGVEIPWDAPLPAIVRKWSLAQKWRAVVIVLVIGDIMIHKDATLSVAAKTKSMMAWNIWIHATGKLVAKGSYLKIWANSISRFPVLPLGGITEALHKTAPNWAYND